MGCLVVLIFWESTYTTYKLLLLPYRDALISIPDLRENTPFLSTYRTASMGRKRNRTKKTGPKPAASTGRSPELSAFLDKIGIDPDVSQL